MLRGDDLSEISAATATLLASVNAGDVAGVLSVWADDGELLPPGHPPVQGLTNLEHYFRTLFRRTRFTFVFTSSHIELFGALAIERVSYAAEAWRDGSSTPVSDRGKGLHVFRREPNGSWKLIRDIWNTDITA